MIALIKNEILSEITDVYVTSFYDYGDGEQVCIEVTKPLTPRQLDFLKNEGVSDSAIEKLENQVYYYDMQEWENTDVAFADAENRIKAALKNGYIDLSDLTEEDEME